MSLPSISFQDIEFPIYIVGNSRPSTEDGVSYFIKYYKNEDTQEEKQNISILDDTNAPYDSLAKRRLYLLGQGVRLKDLGKAIFFPGDLVKLATPTVWFIDSKGKLFQYRKVAKARLKFHKITKIIRIPTGGAILEVEGISSRFKTLYTPTPDITYAGLLHLGNSLILYGVYDQKYDNTWRSI